MPLHNTGTFSASNSNVSYFAGVLCVSVLLLSKRRGESLEFSKTPVIYDVNFTVNVFGFFSLIHTLNKTIN